MTLRPLNDYVLVVRLWSPEKVGSARERLAVGRVTHTPEGAKVWVSSLVYFNPHETNEITYEGHVYLAIKQQDLIAVEE